MRKIPHGFTIVELIIVIVVIGILATISIVGFSRYQAGARDSQRSNRATLIVEALEKFYLDNGEYPSCSAMTGLATTVTSSTLRNLDTSVLKTPQAVNGVTNSILCQDLTNALTDPDIFSYIGDGGSDCLGSGSCLQYTIKYKEEQTGTIKTIFSRHKTDIATSGTPTIAASTVNTSSINLSWTKVSNATNYTVQSTIDPTFNSGVVVSYYFRVAASTSNSQTSWSNTANARTLAVLVAPPSVTATTNSSSQITVAWGSVTDAASYTLDYSVNSSFTSATSISGITSTSQVITGLLQGQGYYFRVSAVNAISTGPASAAVNAITTVDTPGAPVVSASNAGNTITYTWSSVACPVNTTVRYQYQLSIDYAPVFTMSWVSVGSSLNTSYTTSDEGYQYTIVVQAQCYNASSSPWGGYGTASYIRPVNPPTALTFQMLRTDIDSTNRRVTWQAGATCTGNTIPYTRLDPEIIDASISWAPTTNKGWYADSGAGVIGVWARNSFGYNLSISTTKSPTYIPIGSHWATAVDLRCQNTTTSRASASTGRVESGTLTLP
jgi:prepilin-type N-terminal cleavage/methylation domain-containing protein